jgi:hypothetical protein
MPSSHVDEQVSLNRTVPDKNVAGPNRPWPVASGHRLPLALGAWTYRSSMLISPREGRLVLVIQKMACQVITMQFKLHFIIENKVDRVTNSQANGRHGPETACVV